MSEIHDGVLGEDGTVDFGRVFITFTRHTEQKISHGLIVEALLAGLKRREVVLKDGKPTTLVDLGCGEGHTASELVDAVNRVHPQGTGLNYYGRDADPRFVRSTERLLLESKRTRRLQVIDVRRADVLAGEPLLDSPIDDVLVTLGHVLYYAFSPEGANATRARIENVIARVVEILGHDGLCLFVHNAHACPLANLRTSVTNSVEAKPADFVTEVAKEEKLVVLSVMVPFQLCFPRLALEQWEKTKDPAHYRQESSRDRRFLTTLELLTFVAQRSMKGLAKESQLETFVHEVRSQTENGREKGDWLRARFALELREIWAARCLSPFSRAESTRLVRREKWDRHQVSKGACLTW